MYPERVLGAALGLGSPEIYRKGRCYTSAWNTLLHDQKHELGGYSIKREYDFIKSEGGHTHYHN